MTNTLLALEMVITLIALFVFVVIAPAVGAAVALYSGLAMVIGFTSVVVTSSMNI